MKSKNTRETPQRDVTSDSLTIMQVMVATKEPIVEAGDTVESSNTTAESDDHYLLRLASIQGREVNIRRYANVVQKPQRRNNEIKVHEHTQLRTKHVMDDFITRHAKIG